MKNEILSESFQTGQNTIEKITITNETNEMQTNFQNLHVERKIWNNHNKNEICCVFLCVIHDKWKPSSHELFVLLQKSCECSKSKHKRKKHIIKHME
jgi:hypothetical protein